MSLRKNFKIAYGQTKDSILLPELEFRLGHVEKVITSDGDVPLTGEQSNPKQDYVSQIIKLTPSKGLLPSKKKSIYASPLLRGVSDSITRGDSVMWINIGGQVYYLGPINTTNSPNQVPDDLTSRRKNISDSSSGYGSIFPFKSVSKLDKFKT